MKVKEVIGVVNMDHYVDRTEELSPELKKQQELHFRKLCGGSGQSCFFCRQDELGRQDTIFFLIVFLGSLFGLVSILVYAAQNGCKAGG